MLYYIIGGGIIIFVASAISVIYLWKPTKQYIVRKDEIKYIDPIPLSRIFSIDPLPLSDGFYNDRKGIKK